MGVKHKVRVNGYEKFRTMEFTPIKAIRHHCNECMGFQPSLIQDCGGEFCALYPFRMGRNPSRQKPKIS